MNAADLKRPEKQGIFLESRIHAQDPNEVGQEAGDVYAGSSGYLWLRFLGMEIARGTVV